LINVERSILKIPSDITSSKCLRKLIKYPNEFLALLSIVSLILHLIFPLGYFFTDQRKENKSKKHIMEIPKFLLGDNTDHPDDIFIIHTEYPHFIINLLNDDIEWFDELRGDETEIAVEIAKLIEESSEFYDREMERYVED
jgi:hypothetical protein